LQTPAIASTTNESGSSSAHPAPIWIDSALAGKFAYESTLQTFSPSANFFWCRKRQETPRLIRRQLGKLRHLGLHSPEPPLLIDLGAGEAIDLFLIHAQLCQAGLRWRCLGIDGDPAALELAARRRAWLIENGNPDATGVELMQFNVTQPLPLPNGSVSFLAEHQRLLRPGGLLLLTTPNEPNPLQKNWWTPAGRRAVRTLQARLRQQPESVTINGQAIPIYDHISCRPTHRWDSLLARHGLRLLTKAALDAVPRRWTRHLAVGHMGLYERC
jgi:SAM-dependent methyltransferase